MSSIEDEQPDEHVAEGEHAGPQAVRPDEMSRELFAFLAAIDAYKRRTLKQQLLGEDVYHVLRELRYAPAQRTTVKNFAREYDAVLTRYRRERKRLFPTWGEIHALVQAMGWSRAA